MRIIFFIFGFFVCSFSASGQSAVELLNQLEKLIYSSPQTDEIPSLLEEKIVDKLVKLADSNDDWTVTNRMVGADTIEFSYVHYVLIGTKLVKGQKVEFYGFEDLFEVHYKIQGRWIKKNGLQKKMQPFTGNTQASAWGGNLSPRDRDFLILVTDEEGNHPRTALCFNGECVLAKG